jgi:uncharacterized LabA/DUF88 family protein
MYLTPKLKLGRTDQLDDLARRTGDLWSTVAKWHWRFVDRQGYWLSKKCGRHFTKHEEKETDVAIAARLLEILVEDRCDTAVILSGDTDLASAYRAATRLAPDKTVTFAFPYNRANSELEQLADFSFKIGTQQYLNHQFDDPHVLADGTEIDKPPSR